MSQDSSQANRTVHFMIDLETYDTVPSAVILSIGACVVYQPYQIVDPEDRPTFYTELDIGKQFARTRSISAMKWWTEQGENRCPNRGVNTIDWALIQLTNFIWKQALSIGARPIIWCKGTDFDTAILADAYRQMNRELPWKYNDVRDFRTVKKLCLGMVDPKIENPEPHHALADAIFQARQLESMQLELM